MPKVTFVERDGNPRTIEARAGQTLLEIAWDNRLDVEGACEGSMACATCHVIVDPDWFRQAAGAFGGRGGHARPGL